RSRLVARPCARRRWRAVDVLERPLRRRHRRDRRPEAERGCAGAPADAARRGGRVHAARVRAVRRVHLLARGLLRRRPVPASRGRRAATLAGVRDTSPMERVLILAGDAVEDLELFFILYRLREAGY